MSSPAGIESGRNYKRTQVKVTGLRLALLTFQTLGIIYSDIGTSPLYVLNGIWPSDGPLPSSEDVVGGISAIIWSLTLVPLLKYIIISLRFGTTEGEGGTFALYQTLFPPDDDDHEADRTLTLDNHEHKFPPDQQPSFQSDKRRIGKHLRWPLLFWCLFGTALTMADGILTPAVSVTSAVGGIGVAKPSINNDVIPISIAFLLMLFMIQRFGTSRISLSFAPISFCWLLSLMLTGIYNVTRYPGIFRAFDPSRAIMLFVRTGDYNKLGGVLLAVTGCEAVFANLGQFNVLSIQLSFSFFVYPSLVIAYLGQGARLISDGEAVFSNVFYNTIPGPKNGPLFWIVFILAILATLVASQAMITATFSLAQQVINMKSFPPLRMRHTSDTFQGQVYIPAFNWTLMILTIIIVGAFSNLNRLTNAYGFAVSTVMLSTTILLSISIYYVKHKHWIISVSFMLFFGFVDALFWGSALKKIPAGAWVPLLIGVIVMNIMSIWTWGKSLEDRFDRANRKNLRHFIQESCNTDSASTLHETPAPNSGVVVVSETDVIENRIRTLSYVPRAQKFGEDGDEASVTEEKRELQRISTCAIFHKFTRGAGVPHTFVGFIRQWPALPRVVIFLSVCVLPVARVPQEERYVVRKVRSLEGIYGVTYYHGFRDKFHIESDYLVDKICTSEIQANPDASSAWLEEIRFLVGNATHIIPHHYLVGKKVQVRYLSPVVNFVRKWLIEDVYRRLFTMFPQTANWMTPADEIIRVGINAYI
ncbi:hypothetical protein AX17_006255 [Amanita inopinata Kibby_2008]|nr:hypothetical protein AX17_006255 [Amanita inopinata Kibby_2008]